MERRAGTSHALPANVPHRLVGLLDNAPVCVTRCEYGLAEQTAGFVRLLPDGRAEHRYWHQQHWRHLPAPAHQAGRPDVGA